MPTFSYTAKTTDGQSVRGVLSADNQSAALRMLDEKALFPVSISEGAVASGRSLLGRPKGVKLRHLSVFYGQLADLLRAGVPLLRALDVLSRQKGRPVLTGVLKQLREDVSGGQSLADALSKHPHIFKELHVAMVAAGERGGFLEEVLARIGGFVERQDELRNKLFGSMIYPCVLVLGGMGVVTFMMTYIVPRIRPFIENRGPQPVLTIALFGLCDFFTHTWAVLAGLVGLALVAGSLYVRSPRGRRTWDQFSLRAPLLGPLMTIVCVCRFCRILGTLLQNGVPILQALRISRGSAGNAVLAEAIDSAAESVREGETLAEPLAASGLFPPEIIDMVAVAEESNNLEAVLVQIADANEARTARTIDLGVRLVEPVLLVIIAGMVLLIALGLLTPILSGSMGRLG